MSTPPSSVLRPPSSDSDVVISVEGLSKSYLVGHEGPRESYHSLRDTLVRHGKNYARKAIDMARGRQIIQGDSVDEFWALKDVSFEVKRGEVLGIIGRNGAGKSTLLKVLSRITEPTSGRVVLDGRVASLLEVGTGFHPELTGRENIFLNGAILGMHRAEIREKFDEIVAFAEVEKFLDTPVKRYSSGMYVRLAFAVAAHLEPEILIVDEVLAVGDAQFQKKCLGKMQEVAGHGRTVLFVSHNMAAVQALCSRAIHIVSGRIGLGGGPEIVIQQYLQEGIVRSKVCVTERNDREGNGAIKFTDVRVSSPTGELVEVVKSGDTIDISLLYRVHQSVNRPLFYVAFYDLTGIQLFEANTRSVEGLAQTLPENGCITCRVPDLPLPPGEYLINVAVAEASTMLDRLEEALKLRVEAGDFFGTGSLDGAESGKLLVHYEWKSDTHVAS